MFMLVFIHLIDEECDNNDYNDGYGHDMEKKCNYMQ